MLEIPLDHINGVRADPNPSMGWFDGLKVAGADIPHTFRAGLFYKGGDRDFWDVRHPKKTIVIDLGDEGFAPALRRGEGRPGRDKEIEAALAEHQNLTDDARQELEAYLQSTTEPDSSVQHISR